LSFDDTIRKFGPNDLAAMGTNIAMQTIFDDNQRVIAKFDNSLNTDLVQFFASTFFKAAFSVSS